MSHQRLTLLAILFGLCLVGTMPGVAAEDPKLRKPLRFSLRPIIPKPRSHAPQMFEIGLDCDVDKFFEGRLEVKWYLGKRLVHEYLSHELGVTAGGQKWRITLPPILVHAEKTPVMVYARFLTSREVLELTEANPPAIPVDWKRSFVIACVQPREAYVQPRELGGSQFQRRLVNALGLEQFGPRAEQQFNLLSHPASLTPEELPALATGYASVDLLVLEGEGFRQAKPQHLSAIGDWVAGGGSLIVAPPDTISARHVEFLNRLAGWRAAAGPYVLDERGRFVVDESLPAGRKFARFRLGAGRAVVIQKALDPDREFETAEWRATVAFLWKVQATQLEKILETGAWDFTPPAMSQNFLTPRPFAPQANGLGESIRRFLMPERIEGVPLSVVAVILALFLLAVAPGDYLLLGRLNCRKYTWWLFVLVSASFTFSAVKVAEHYMGHVDFRTALTFVDLETVRGESGVTERAARSSRFELLFVARQQLIETPLRNCLYVDLTERGGRQEDVQFRRPRFAQFDESELDEAEAVDTDLPAFEGSLPAPFKVHQRLRQWSPRITRRTTFADDPAGLPELPIDWNSLSGMDLNVAKVRQALFEAVLAREPEAQVMLLHQRRAFGPDMTVDVTTDAAPGTPGGVSYTPPGAGRATGSALPFPELQSAAPVLLLAANASVRPSVGLFAIVAQVSPTGGENLEDLALLDQTDAGEWLLIAAVRRNSDWIVYRKLLRSSSAVSP